MSELTTEMMSQYINLQQCIEKALDKYLEQCPNNEDRLRYWQSFTVEDWREDSATLEIFWATPSYSGHPSENGTESFPLVKLMPYLKAQWELDEFDRKLETTKGVS